MSKKVKTRTVNIPVYRWIDGYEENRYGDQSLIGVSGSRQESETIIYDSYPMYTSGKLNWKYCEHTSIGVTQGNLCSAKLRDDSRYWNRKVFTRVTTHVNPRFPIPNGAFPREELAKGIRDQIDLNCRETVLLYSGILQAVPLVGSVFKLSSILKQASRHVRRSMRKQPFSTVLRGLISADFIDRFVIKPTLDDARKFLDAHNYVMRVIDTATSRNAKPFALRVGHKVSHGSASSSGTTSSVGGDYVSYNRTDMSVTEANAYILLEANYDTNAINPIKLWATRLGVYSVLESGWDLLPFSFVVDYFLKIGDFWSDLTHQVTSQEGLVGHVSNIYDLWGSLNNESRVVLTGTRLNSRWPIIESVVLGQQVTKSAKYLRFPIGDPYRFIESYGWDFFLKIPSHTQLRTLAELLIQAKL